MNLLLMGRENAAVMGVNVKLVTNVLLVADDLITVTDTISYIESQDLKLDAVPSRWKTVLKPKRATIIHNSTEIRNRAVNWLSYRPRA